MATPERATHNCNLDAIYRITLIHRFECRHFHIRQILDNWSCDDQAEIQTIWFVWMRSACHIQYVIKSSTDWGLSGEHTFTLHARTIGSSQRRTHLYFSRFDRFNSLMRCLRSCHTWKWHSQWIYESQLIVSAHEIAPAFPNFDRKIFYRLCGQKK